MKQKHRNLIVWTVVALATLITCVSIADAQDKYPIPVCPNHGSVDMGIFTIPDHILYSGMKETVVSFEWDIGHFPESENWMLEVWFWDGRKEQYTAYDSIPFSREYWELDVPWLALDEKNPPIFYVRHIYQNGYNRCGRTEWHLGDVRELHCIVEPAEDGEAWVYDASVHRMVLKPVVLAD
jgi:hypothetical protein